MSETSSEFKFNREIGVVAVLGFILALIGAVIDLFRFWAGEDLSMYPPEQIDFFVVPVSETSDGSWLTAHAEVTFINDAPSPYNGVIVKEEITFELEQEEDPGFRSVILTWQNFVNVDAYTGTITPVGNAQPVLVPAKGATSHEASFFAKQKFCDNTSCDVFQNFIDYQTFLSALESMDSLEITFIATTRNGIELSHACSIFIDELFISTIENNNYYPAPCYTES